MLKLLLYCSGNNMLDRWWAAKWKWFFQLPKCKSKCVHSNVFKACFFRQLRLTALTSLAQSWDHMAATVSPSTTPALQQLQSKHSIGPSARCCVEGQLHMAIEEGWHLSQVRKPLTSCLAWIQMDTVVGLDWELKHQAEVQLLAVANGVGRREMMVVWNLGISCLLLDWQLRWKAHLSACKLRAMDSLRTLIAHRLSEDTVNMFWVCAHPLPTVSEWCTSLSLNV